MPRLITSTEVATDFIVYDLCNTRVFRDHESPGTAYYDFCVRADIIDTIDYEIEIKVLVKAKP